jgi:hypothetical protein
MATETLGSTVAGATDGGSDNGVLILNQATIASDGTVASVSVGIATYVASSHVNICIYTNASGLPGALIWSSGSLALTASGVNTFSLSGPTLTAGTYWIGCINDVSGTGLSVDQSTGSIAYYKEFVGFTSPPATFTASGNVPVFGVQCYATLNVTATGNTATASAVAGGSVASAACNVGTPITSTVAAVAGGASARATVTIGSGINITAAAVAGAPIAAAPCNVGSPITCTTGAVAGAPSASASVTVGSSTYTYSTNFDGTESPISEAGHWVKNGLDWTDVVTAGGVAYGTQTGANTYDDSYAYLPAMGGDQRVDATVHRNTVLSGGSKEVECLLRAQDGPHTARFYECNFAMDGGYAQCVIWHGPYGSWSYLYQGFVRPLVDGDVVSAAIVGNVITSYLNGTALFSVTDTDNNYPTGSPGIGFYKDATGTPGEFGFTTVTVTASEQLNIATAAAVAGAPTAAATCKVGVPITCTAAAVSGGAIAAASDSIGVAISCTGTAVAGGASYSATCKIGSPVSCAAAAVAGGASASALVSIGSALLCAGAAIAGGPIAAATCKVGSPLSCTVVTVAGAPMAAAACSVGIPLTCAGAAVTGASVAAAVVVAGNVTSCVANCAAGSPVASATCTVGQPLSCSVVVVAGAPTVAATVAVGVVVYCSAAAVAGAPMAAATCTVGPSTIAYRFALADDSSPYTFRLVDSTSPYRFQVKDD